MQYQTINSDRALLEQLPLQQNTVQKLHKTIHHFTPFGKLGYPQGVQCWCGATLEFCYHEPGMSKRRRAFFEHHEECLPPGQEPTAI